MINRELIELKKKLLEAGKARPLIDELKSQTQLTLSSNRKIEMEHLGSQGDLTLIENFYQEASSQKRFGNLLSMKMKLSKRLTKLKNIEEIYQRLEKQNFGAEHVLLCRVLGALKEACFPERDFLNDYELCSALDTTDITKVDIEKFVDVMEQEKNA